MRDYVSRLLATSYDVNRRVRRRGGLAAARAQPPDPGLERRDDAGARRLALLRALRAEPRTAPCR